MSAAHPVPLGDILIVDDNIDNIRLLTTVLKNKGYKPRQVTSGIRALEVVGKKAPDLILLDIQMPGLNGFEVCTRLKASAETRDIPVIFITAQGSTESKVQGFSVGGGDYITKPLQVDEVLARVGHQLEIRRLAKGISQRNRQLEQILHALPIPYVITLADGRLYRANRLALDLLGIKGQEMGTITSAEFYADAGEREALINAIFAKGRVQNHELRLKSRRHREFWALVSAALFELDEDMGIFVGINDITARKELELALEKQAMTDPLTGIYNRRAFIEQAEKRYTMARRHNFSLSVLLFDIDHFKRINDTWGHDVGDLALKHFTATVSRTLRETDIFSRIGGEEFAVLLSSDRNDRFMDTARRFLKAVETTPMTFNGGELTMTASAGLSLWPPDTTLDQVLSQADKALYRAKEGGRNRVESV